MCPSRSAPFRREERRSRQFVRSVELHGETLRAERFAPVLRKEVEYGVGLRHASRNTFVDVRQASQPASAFVTLRVLLILIKVILTRPTGTVELRQRGVFVGKTLHRQQGHCRSAHPAAVDPAVKHHHRRNPLKDRLSLSSGHSGLHLDTRQARWALEDQGGDPRDARMVPVEGRAWGDHG